MNNSLSALHIPVLTEIIEMAPATEPTEAEPVPGPSAAAGQDQTRLSDFMQEKQKWDDLEGRLTARILQLVQERISFILAHNIRDSLSAVLDKATEELSAEIRSDLQNTLEVVVSHAVSQEFTRLQQGDVNQAENESERN